MKGWDFTTRSTEKGQGNLSFRYVKRFKELRDAFYGRDEMEKKFFFLKDSAFTGVRKDSKF